MFLDTGWHRVITDEISLKHISKKGTPVIEQLVYCVETGKEFTTRHWATDKALPRFARWAEVLGCDESMRAHMDTEAPATLKPLIGRTCWILIDHRQNNQNGKWYKEMVSFQPDGPEKPQSEPKYPTRPAAPAGSASAAAPAGAGAAAHEEDDIPF